MADHIETQTELLCGRVFTQQELQEIQDIIRLFPRLSQTELAKTICEMLSWVAPNGKYKLESCRELLKKLELREWVSLPIKRHVRSPRKEQALCRSHTDAEPEITGLLSELGSIQLQPVRSQQDIRLWNEYVDRYHMLGYKRPFGAHQRYFIWSGNSQNRRLGCMLFSASAWALARRDAWIGWSTKDRNQRLYKIVNNTRFLIFPWVKVSNLASKALSVAAKRISSDWKDRYGFEPVLLETFVDVAFYKGTCYRAANWVEIGMTSGRGRMDRHTQHLSSPKKIFVYPLRPDFRMHLINELGE
ncbi:MAG: DUF4338 domain-containing protein [Paenibacillaceae bacterium]